MVQRCTACDHTRHPPAPVCPECRSTEADWLEGPEGRIDHNIFKPDALRRMGRR